MVCASVWAICWVGFEATPCVICGAATAAICGAVGKVGAGVDELPTPVLVVAVPPPPSNLVASIFLILTAVATANAAALTPFTIQSTGDGNTDGWVSIWTKPLAADNNAVAFCNFFLLLNAASDVLASSSYPLAIAPVKPESASIVADITLPVAANSSSSNCCLNLLYLSLIAVFSASVKSNAANSFASSSASIAALFSKYALVPDNNDCPLNSNNLNSSSYFLRILSLSSFLASSSIFVISFVYACFKLPFSSSDNLIKFLSASKSAKSFVYLSSRSFLVLSTSSAVAAVLIALTFSLNSSFDFTSSASYFLFISATLLLYDSVSFVVSIPNLSASFIKLSYAS